MNLDDIRLIDFRCIGDQLLPLDARLNVIVGDNGAGKTSILEAVYLLGRPASFRSGQPGEVIRHGAKATQVISHCRIGGQPSLVAMERSRQGLRLRRDGEDLAGYSELSRLMPIVAVEPGQHRVIEDGPVVRRRLIDWSVFHVEHQFLGAWRRYAQALRLRNQGLRLGDARLVRSCDAVFVDLALQVSAMRRRVVTDLEARTRIFWSELTGQAADHLELVLNPGWKLDHDLADVLTSNLSADMERRHTMYGPHRAELRIQLQGRSARSLMSRGQRKILMLAIALAQAEQIDQLSGNAPVLLIDDFGSEWSLATQNSVLGRLLDVPYQLLLTMLDSPSDLNGRHAMFHVEHGAVARVI